MLPQMSMNHLKFEIMKQTKSMILFALFLVWGMSGAMGQSNTLAAGGDAEGSGGSLGGRMGASFDLRTDALDQAYLPFSTDSVVLGLSIGIVSVARVPLSCCGPILKPTPNVAPRSRILYSP